MWDQALKATPDPACQVSRTSKPDGARVLSAPTRFWTGRHERHTPNWPAITLAETQRKLSAKLVRALKGRFQPPVTHQRLPTARSSTGYVSRSGSCPGGHPTGLAGSEISLLQQRPRLTNTLRFFDRFMAARSPTIRAQAAAAGQSAYGPEPTTAKPRNTTKTRMVIWRGEFPATSTTRQTLAAIPPWAAQPSGGRRRTFRSSVTAIKRYWHAWRWTAIGQTKRLRGAVREAARRPYPPHARTTPRIGGPSAHCLCAQAHSLLPAEFSIPRALLLDRRPIITSPKPRRGVCREAATLVIDLASRLAAAPGGLPGMDSGRALGLPPTGRYQ